MQNARIENTLSPLALLLCVAACSSGGPLLREPRSWSAPLEQGWSHSKTVLAAAVVDEEPAAPAPTPAKKPGPTVLKVKGTLPPIPGVRLLADDSAECPTQALAVINEHADDGDQTAAETRLKAKAEKLGAEMVLGFRAEPSEKGSGKDLTGLAVKCAQITSQRPYETLATLDVPATPGAEDLAFQDLRDKAEKLHADLVVDIQVLPDGEGSRVVGKAIKYQ